MSVRIAVVGTGYWGLNHVRAFVAQRDATVVAVCDPDPQALARAVAIAPGARDVSVFPDVLGDDVDGVVLATPALLHADQVRAALLAGKHVFVEKPMALSVEDAETLVTLVASVKRVCMVGHLMIYHPAVRRLEELLRDGTIGDVHYIYSSRVNLGRLRRDENALWSLGPHDLSMIIHLLGAVPTRVSARGQSFLQPGIEDVVFVHLEFPAGKMAHVHLSWLDPRKERRMIIVGSRRMVEFDDVHPTEKLKIYDKGYDRPPSFADFGEYLTLRHGDVQIPRLEMVEPLAIECGHFVRAIAQGDQPDTGAREGAAVVRVLAAAQCSLERGGEAIDVK